MGRKAGWRVGDRHIPKQSQTHTIPRGLCTSPGSEGDRHGCVQHSPFPPNQSERYGTTHAASSALLATTRTTEPPLTCGRAGAGSTHDRGTSHGPPNSERIASRRSAGPRLVSPPAFKRHDARHSLSQSLSIPRRERERERERARERESSGRGGRSKNDTQRADF